MRVRPRDWRVYLAIAIAAAAPVLLGLTGWPPDIRAVEVAALLIATVLNVALERRPAPTSRSTMTISFVIDFAALLLTGSTAATIVATVIAATQVAGFVHLALGGTTGHFEWPSQGVPIAAAAVAYCFVRYASFECLVPLFTRQTVNRQWLRGALRDIPDFLIGAGAAAAIVAAIDHRMWELLLVTAVPLVYVYRACGSHLDRLDREGRQSYVIESLDQGMCIVNREGRCGTTRSNTSSTVRARMRSVVRSLPRYQCWARPSSSARSTMPWRMAVRGRCRRSCCACLAGFEFCESRSSPMPGA